MEEVRERSMAGMQLGRFGPLMMDSAKLHVFMPPSDPQRLGEAV